MKKLLAIIMCVLLVSSMTACSNNKGEAETDMSLEEQMSAILEGVELPTVQNIEITDENIEAYLFIPPVEGAKALVSEPMINAIAHSVALMRVPEGMDIEAVAASIRENMNPRKWICAEAEKAEVVTHARTILMVMSSPETAAAIVANFDAMYK